MRWMFDSKYLGIYGYYANRTGMNYLNQPPTRFVRGEFIMTDVEIIPGKSYVLSMTVTTNDPGVANGTLKAPVNGVQKINKSGMHYMSGKPQTDYSLPLITEAMPAI